MGRTQLPSMGTGELKFGARPLSFCELARELSMSPVAAADPLFGAAWAAIGLPGPTRPWTLPLVNGVAVAAIIGAVAYRIWEAHPPAEVLREEAILIGIGAIFAVVA